MKTPTLEKPSTWLRSTVARGIASGETAAISRTGGKFGAGIIRDFAVIMRGEALGHGMWIDSTMLEQVSAAINKSPNDSGIKARFAHPSLSGDGIGKMTSRVFSSRVDGDVVRAEAHFLQAAHAAPDGDLASYVMSLAEEDPEAFGASISFRRDIQAEEEFIAANGGKKKRDEYGTQYWDLSEFKSPDPKNVDNLRHARLKVLRAVDFVDSPAANPNGLFHEEIFDVLERGEGVLDYVFGITDAPPDHNLGIDADRLKGFAARWAATRKFSFQKDETMTTATAPAAAPAAAPASTPAAAPANLTSETTTITAPAGGSAPALSGDTAPVLPAATPALPPANPALNAGTGTAPVLDAAALQKQAREEALADSRKELARYTAQFGAVNGAAWFGEGLSFEAAKDKHIEHLQKVNADQAAKLNAATAGIGEDKPLSGEPNGSKTPSKYEEGQQLNANLSRVAVAIEAQMSRLTIPQPSKN